MFLSNTVESTLLYLISCVVNSKKPDLEIVKETNFEQLYALCKRHFVTAICYYAISSAYDGQTPQTELFVRWKQDKDMIIRKTVLFDMEYEKLAKYLDENNVWHVRLKGAEIQKYYPSPEMREMSDIDILFDDSKFEIAESFFLDNGYILESEIPSHYEFLKKPVYNFEMHKLLFSTDNNQKFYEYYVNVKEKLVLKDGTLCTYLFKPEDQFVFYLAHEYKHYSDSGVGIRSLLDCYLMKTKAPEEFDWEYVAREMEKLEIKAFYDSFIELSLRVFSGEDINDAESMSDEAKRELETLINSGVYGNNKNRVKNQMKGISKGKNLSKTSVKFIYIIKRLFPDRAFFKKYFPKLAAKKYPLFFLWIYRIFRGVFKKGKQISKEIKYIRENDID